MKKVKVTLLALAYVMVFFTDMRAQTTLNISLLKSNKWMLIEDGTKDTVHVSFDNKKMYASEHLHYIHPKSRKVIDKTLKIDYTYYLSNAVSDSYDAGKVGKATTGNLLRCIMCLQRMWILVIIQLSRLQKRVTPK